MNKARLFSSVAALLIVVAGASPTVLANGPGDIHKAAQAGHIGKVKSLLQGDPDLATSRDKSRRTPLHAAALGRAPAAMIEVLLAGGAKIDAASGDGQTPLHVAASTLNSAAVEALLAFDAKPSLKDARQRTPLHLAGLTGLNDKPSAERRVAITTALLARGADVAAVDEEAMTPLHIAAVKGRQRMTDLLLAAESDVQAADARGRTPLHWAAAGNHKGVMVRLLESRAGIDSPDTAGNTPLHCAAMRFRENAIELLLAHAAETGARNKTGATPLITLVTARHGDRDVDPAVAAVARLLLDAGADVNASDHAGHTALYYARENGWSQTVEALRAAGAR